MLQKRVLRVLFRKEESVVCISGMYYLLYLCVALLTGCSGESLVDEPPKVVQGFAGGDVILPCSVKIPPSDDFPTVEWSKEGLKPNVVFLYRDGCETYEMKNPAFHYRTSFITKELKDGNISLRISKVRLSDAGKYQCMTLWKNAPRDVTAVELVVVAVSEPKLSVVSAESGGVTFQCEAGCWLPEPEIEFLDDRGNYIPADDPKRNQDTSGCFNVTRRVTLQGAANRVSCRVHQPEINQTRVTEILLPADHMRFFLITGIAVGEGVLLLIVASYFLCKKCGKSVGSQKTPVTRQSSDQTTMSGTDENQPFLRSVRVDRTVNMADLTTEELTEEADLKSSLLKKDETDHQPQSDLKSQSNPVSYQVQPVFVNSPYKFSPDIPKLFSPPSDHSPNTRNLPDDINLKPTASFASLPQNQDPKPGISGPNSNSVPQRPIPRTHRINSSPALLNFAVLSSFSSDSTSKKKPRSFSRSMSESGARPGPNLSRLQRRHSSVLSSSDNGFPLLTDVDEESDN